MANVCALCRGTIANNDKAAARFCDECASSILLNGADVTPSRVPRTPPTLQRNLLVDAVTPRRRRREHAHARANRTPSRNRSTTPASLAPPPHVCEADAVVDAPRRLETQAKSSTPMLSSSFDASTPRRRGSSVGDTPERRRRTEHSTCRLNADAATPSRCLTPPSECCTPRRRLVPPTLEHVSVTPRRHRTTLVTPQHAQTGATFVSLGGIDVTSRPSRASQGALQSPIAAQRTSLVDTDVARRLTASVAQAAGCRIPLSVVCAVVRPPTSRVDCRRRAYAAARSENRSRDEAENIEPKQHNARTKRPRLDESRNACKEDNEQRCALSQRRSRLRRESHRGRRDASPSEVDAVLSEVRPRKRHRVRSPSPSSVQETPPSTAPSQVEVEPPQSPITRLLELFNEADETPSKAVECTRQLETTERNDEANKEVTERCTPIDVSQAVAQQSTSLQKSVKPRFFVLDTETSGLDPTKHRVIEVAVAPYDVEDEEPLSVLVNVGDILLDPESSAVHGITRAMLTHAHNFEAAWERVRAYVALRTAPHETPVIVAHNAKFDAEFLSAEIRRARRRIPQWRWTCTVQLARILWPAHEVGLAALARRLGVQMRGPAHRAANDVRTLCVVLQGMKAVGEDRGMDVLALLDAAARPMDQFARTKLRGALKVLPQSESYNESVV